MPKGFVSAHVSAMILADIKIERDVLVFLSLAPLVIGEVVTVMASPATTEVTKTSAGPSFHPRRWRASFTSLYVTIFVAPSITARATVAETPYIAEIESQGE